MPANARQLPLDVALKNYPELTHVIAGPNAEALEAAVGLLKQPAQLLVWGGTATGKTLLLQALARRATEQGRTAAYLGLSDSRTRDPDYLAAMLGGLERLDLICVDDVQALAGDAAAERQLVELISRLRANQASLILSAARAPENLALSTDDLRSRLGWGLMYALRELDDDDKIDLLCVRARQKGMTLSARAAAFLLRRESRDLNTLMTLLDQLDRASLAARRALTIPFIREVLDGSTS